LAIREIVTSLSCFGVAFYLSWKLTLMMLATLPVIAILMPLFSSRIQPSIEHQTMHITAAAKHATNAFSIIDTVKCYNGHLQEQQRYAQSIKQAAECYINQVNWHALQSSVLRFITLGIFVQGFWFGSTLVGDNPESAGQVFAAFWSCLVATNSLMAVMPHMMQFEKGKVAASQLHQMIALPVEPSASSFGQLRGHAHNINVRNVRTMTAFAFPC
jgi:ATP-binding cassette subfamily B (MDR/TAP) protein 1